MEAVVRNVRDLDQADRSALERVVGCQLAETQQVIVNVVEISPKPAVGESHDRGSEIDVPEWWKIYDGLSDEEIDELDRAIQQRANLTRHIE